MGIIYKIYHKCFYVLQKGILIGFDHISMNIIRQY